MDWHPISINIGCGVIASFIFLFSVLFLFKPRIKICPFICKTASQFEGESTVYFFKIVHKSMFSGNDVRAELNVLERYPTPPTGMMNTKKISQILKSDHLCSLDPSRPELVLNKSGIEAAFIF